MAGPPFLPANVYRDFKVALNALSGAHEPNKAEIRALLQWVVDAVQAFQAATGADPTITASLRTDLNTEIVRALGAEAVLTARTDAAAVPLVGRTTRARAVASRLRRAPNGFYYGANTFDAFTIVWVPTRTVVKPAALQVDISAASDVAVIRVKAYRRPLANLDTFAPGTGDQAGDKLVFSYDAPVGSLLADYALSNVQTAAIPLNGISGVADMPAVTDLSFGYMFTLEARTIADAPSFLGLAQGIIPPASTPARGRGWARTPGGSWFPLGDPTSLAFTVLEAVGVDQADRSRPLVQATTMVEALRTSWPDQGLADTVGVIIPETVVERAGQALTVPSQLVVHAKPSQATVTDVIGVQPFEISLSHQFINNVSVRRQDNNAFLVEGTDYSINYRRSSILGLKPGLITCNVSYNGRKSRIDLICVDPATGVVSVKGGTERPADASEFVPNPNAGQIPLYGAFVTRADGVDLVSLVPSPNRVLLKGIDWLEYSRQRLPRLARLMRRGSPVRIAGYGDSITEQGGGGSGAAYYTTPNGTFRDTALQSQGGYYWTGRIGADVVNALPAFDQGDGNTRHIRTGWNWYLKAAIEAHSACVVTYDNWGIGGTDASQTEPNGNFPARRNAVIASAPDVVVIAFGMNELGSVFTYGRISTMIDAFKAANIDVIVMGVPLIATSNSVNAINEWRETNAQLEQAARDRDAAFVPLAAFVDPDAPTPLGGVPRRAVSTTNGINHDGPYMLRKYGELLAAIVKTL